MLDRDYLNFVRQLLTTDRLDRFAEVVRNRTRAIAVVLENFYHSQNVAACLRTCDALGVQDVHLVETNIEYRRQRTIDLGASQWLSLQRFRDDGADTATRNCLGALKARGYRIVATLPGDGAHTPESLPLPPRTALVLGGEKSGVSPAVMELADERLALPMYGFVKSYNVSVAAALCLRSLIERLRRERDDWRLTEADQQNLLDEWVHRAARRQFPRAIRQYWKAREVREGSATVPGASPADRRD